MGLGLVLKTMGAVKCLGVGTSSLHNNRCNSVGRMLALGASCPWFESKYPYLNGLCSVIRLAQDICNVLEEFKSHKVHTMFSCFHNVELLLEPSFGQLEVKETALSMLLSSVV